MFKKKQFVVKHICSCCQEGDCGNASLTKEGVWDCISIIWKARLMLRIIGKENYTAVYFRLTPVLTLKSTIHEFTLMSDTRVSTCHCRLCVTGLTYQKLTE